MGAHLVDRARVMRVTLPADESLAYRRHRMSLLNYMFYYDDQVCVAYTHEPVAPSGVGDGDTKRLVVQEDTRIL
jgi:hypothetical protein